MTWSDYVSYFLFKQHADVVGSVIPRYFTVVEAERKSSSCAPTHFGYRSDHYVIKAPDRWRNLPEAAEFDGLKAEIQVRTLAEHVWASASHKLQYKHEQIIPADIQRTINRVSAILEIADSELARALDELSCAKLTPDDADPLLTVRSLIEALPALWACTPYEERFEFPHLLLEQLRELGVDSRTELERIILKWRSQVLSSQALASEQRPVHWTRQAMGLEFPDFWPAVCARFQNQEQQLLKALLGGEQS